MMLGRFLGDCAERAVPARRGKSLRRESIGIRVSEACGVGDGLAEPGGERGVGSAAGLVWKSSSRPGFVWPLMEMPQVAFPSGPASHWL